MVAEVEVIIEVVDMGEVEDKEVVMEEGKEAMVEEEMMVGMAEVDVEDMMKMVDMVGAVVMVADMEEVGLFSDWCSQEKKKAKLEKLGTIPKP